MKAIIQRLLKWGAVFPLSQDEAFCYRGVGIKTCDELYALGLIKEDEFRKLPTRAKRCLMSLKLDTKEQVIEALKTGKLQPGKVRNYGKKTHHDLLTWADIVL